MCALFTSCSIAVGMLALIMSSLLTCAQFSLAGFFLTRGAFTSTRDSSQLPSVSSLRSFFDFVLQLWYAKTCRPPVEGEIGFPEGGNSTPFLYTGTAIG